jgi:K+ potassium transporter
VKHVQRAPSQPKSLRSPSRTAHDAALKFFDGGWFPLLLAMAIFALMTTWSRGRAVLEPIADSRRELLAGVG